MASSLAKDIEAKIRAAITAQEAENYAEGAKLLRSASMLIMAHPRQKFEFDEVEYSQDSLVAMIKEMDRLAVQQSKKNHSSGGFAPIGIRTR